jgi:c-di-GMP-related signal transduction protein
MAKTKYEPAGASVEEMVTKIMSSFPDRFIHIQRNDLLIVLRDSPKCSYGAKTKILNGFYRMLTKKKIVIELWKQGWELDKPAERLLTLYRELYRVDLNEKTKDYKLIKPDLTDFVKILDKVGLHKETVDVFFAKVLESK